MESENTIPREALDPKERLKAVDGPIAAGSILSRHESGFEFAGKLQVLLRFLEKYPHRGYAGEVNYHLQNSLSYDGIYEQKALIDAPINEALIDELYEKIGKILSEAEMSALITGKQDIQELPEATRKKLEAIADSIPDDGLAGTVEN